MKAYFKNLSSTAWALAAIPLVAVAYPVLTVFVPAVLRAVMPETVRAVLRML